MSKFYDKTAASFKSTTIDAKVLDAQKILVNTDSADYAQRVNLIDYIKENTVGEDAELRDLVLGENINKIFNTNTMGGTLDNASITAVQYSSTHFIKGAKLLSIKIPYTDNGTARNIGYLIAAVYDNQESQISLHYSDNTFTFNGDNSSATFTFTDFEIPSDYRFIRFALVSNKNTIPTFTNGTNCLQFRCKPIKFNNTFTFDDDDCQVYNGSTTNNWLIEVEVESISREGGLSSSVTYLENQISDVDSRVTSLENKEITYDKEVTIPTLSEQPTNVGQFNAIIFNQLKVPHDVVIKAIEMPITNNTTSDPLWLVAYNVGPNNTKTLISKSDNSQIVKSGTNARWTFGDGFVISGTDSLAVYIAKENTSIGTSEVAVPGVHIECPQLGSGTDTIRYGAGTYGRDCFAYFNVIEQTSLNNVIDQIKEESETHITREEADSLYIAKTEDNEHILSVLNEEVDVSYAQGWFNLETNTNAWRLRIGQYPDIVAPDNGETLEAAQWVQFINQADIPFEAYAITNVKVGIKAKQPGSQYCVSFKMYYSDNTLVTDQITYSGDTLELSGDVIKRIDYLTSLNNQQQSESNIFDKTVYLKEGAVVSNDIVINGSKLLLANGASIQTIDHAVAPGQGSASNYLVTQTELEEKEQELKQYTQDTIQQNLQQLNTIEPSLPTRRYLVALSGSLVDLDCSRGDDWCLPTTAVIGIPASAPTGVYKFTDNAWLSFWTKVIFNKNKIHKQSKFQIHFAIKKICCTFAPDFKKGVP